MMDFTSAVDILEVDILEVDILEVEISAVDILEVDIKRSNKNETTFRYLQTLAPLDWDDSWQSLLNCKLKYR
jgi:hypothetical protein